MHKNKQKLRITNFLMIKTLLDFKPIELSDKTQVVQIIKNNNYRSSDISFANLFAWSSRFSTQIAIKDNTFFIRSGNCYLFPIGELPIKDALNLILDNEKDNYNNIKMCGITLEMWEEINKSLPNVFEYHLNRDEYEYIYLSEKLINLKGKKLQSKRNHINKFKNKYKDWQYQKITSQLQIQECITMLDEWEKSVSYRIAPSQNDEYIAAKKMLENFDFLQLTVGAIKVNEKVVAFSVGEPLTEDTFVVHIEKAFEDIDGAYSIINQQFIEHEAHSFKYINREEDLGFENLRKAKISYQPEMLLEQGFCMMISKVSMAL